MRSTIFVLALAVASLAAGSAHAATDAAPQAQRQTTPPPPPPTTAKPAVRPPTPPPPPPPAPAGIPHDRGIAFFDVAFQPGTASFTDRRSFSLNRESASLTSDYDVKAGAGIDGGAFVRLWKRFGVGLAVSSIVRDSAATVTGSYPHPFFFNQARSGSFETETLDRAEVGVHPSVAWMAPASNRFRFVAFAGPSFFTITQTVVDQPTLTDTYPYDAITLAAGSTTDIEESAVGVHVGADATWYFTSRLGAGVLARFATGTKSVSVNGGDSFDLKAGGAQIGVGLRFKF